MTVKCNISTVSALAVVGNCSHCVGNPSYLITLCYIGYSVDSEYLYTVMDSWNRHYK